MLWNWNTVDSCFIAESWHITSNGMFAGSCIGVILLVMSLEFLRRASREYDSFIVRQAKYNYQLTSSSSNSSQDNTTAATVPKAQLCSPAAGSFRPNLVQQLIRAAFHMAQFAVAYIIMLLAMYYNGYIIICIVIGAFLGAFVFSWEAISLA